MNRQGHEDNTNELKVSKLNDKIEKIKINGRMTYIECENTTFYKCGAISAQRKMPTVGTPAKTCVGIGITYSRNDGDYLILKILKK